MNKKTPNAILRDIKNLDENELNEIISLFFKLLYSKEDLIEKNKDILIKIMRKFDKEDFHKKYELVLNIFSEDELKLLFKYLQKKYDLKSYIETIKPTKKILEEQRKHYTIKELAEIYHCSESTIKRRLGTKK